MKKNGLLVLVTMLLVAAGAAMPFVSAWFQDTRQLGEESRSFASFSLTLKRDTDLGRTLRAVDWVNQNYTVSDVVEETALTEWEAYSAAEDTMSALFEHGLLYREVLEGLAHPRIVPQTIITNTGGMQEALPVLPAPEDGEYKEYVDRADVNAQASGGDSLSGGESISIATWTVHWEEPAEYYLWLDDASGKAFMIAVTAPVTTVDKDAYVRLEKWRLFIEDYYDTEVQDIQEVWYGNAAWYMMTFPLGEDEEPVSLTLIIYLPEGLEVLSPFR